MSNVEGERQITVAHLLKRKQEIDTLASGQFVETQRWLVEAVELLLQIQHQKEKSND